MYRSPRLSDALIADLSEDQLADILREIGWQDCEATPTDFLCNRKEILAAVQSDEDAQKHLVKAWRERHNELCELMGELPITATLDHCLICYERFGAAAVLLEMLTDPHDDGWELARWTVGQLPPSAIRSELEQLLSSWEVGSESDSECKPKRRIIVFGGHPRDEIKFLHHQFEAADVTLIWNTFEKTRRAPDERTIGQSMQTADAVIVVTKLVSHNVMYMVKRAANRLAVPFHCIEKATASQLERVIREVVEQPDPDVGSS